MSYNWFEYIDFSKEISSLRVRSSFRDAYNRSILSRSYYAVFNKAARIYEKKTGTRLRTLIGQNSHNVVIDWFKNDPDPTKAKIGSYLKQLKDLRKEADYERSFTPTDNQADLNCSIAEATFNDLISLK